MNTLDVRVPAELDRRLRLIARWRGRDLADEMRDALAAHAERAVEELTNETAPRTVTKRGAAVPSVEGTAGARP